MGASDFPSEKLLCRPEPEHDHDLIVRDAKVLQVILPNAPVERVQKRRQVQQCNARQQRAPG